MSGSVLARITEAALQIMVKRASNLEPGESFTAGNIVSAVVAEPQGPVALYLASLIVTGVQHYPIYAELYAAGEAE